MSPLIEVNDGTEHPRYTVYKQLWNRAIKASDAGDSRLAALLRRGCDQLLIASQEAYAYRTQLEALQQQIQSRTPQH